MSAARAKLASLSLSASLCCAVFLAACAFSYDSGDKSFGGGDAAQDEGRPPAPAPDTTQDLAKDGIEPRSGSCEVLLQCAMAHNFCGFLSNMFREYPSDECVAECLGGTSDEGTRKQYMGLIRCGGQKCGDLYLKGDAEGAAKCIKDKCKGDYEGLCEFTYY